MSQKPTFDSPDESNPDIPSLAERHEVFNEEGAVAYEGATSEQQLYKVVLNNLLEDTYYNSVDDLIDKVWDNFDAVADENPEFVLQLAAHVRQEEGLRDIPQLLLVFAANDDRTQEFVRDYTPAIIDRMDEFNSVVSYQIRGYGKPIPKPLQKGTVDALHKKYCVVEHDNDTYRATWVESNDSWSKEDGIIRAVSNGEYTIESTEGADILRNTELLDEGYIFNEYTSAKYAQRDKQVSLRDVINLVRPNPRSENRNELFGKIVKGDLDTGRAKKAHWDVGSNAEPSAVEPLRQDRTWEAEMSKDDDRTPEEKWRARLDDMGLMARVRNLRNMREAGLSGDEIFDYDDGYFLDNSAGLVRDHQMLPMRYYQSYMACADAGERVAYKLSRFVNNSDESVLDEESSAWLNSAIDVATENLPESLTNTFTAVDLSGSMDDTISSDSTLHRAEIASLFGAMLMKHESDVGVFGEDFAPVQMDASTRVSIPTLELANQIYEAGSSVGAATNGWKAIDWARQTDRKYDRFVVFTDEQIWDSQSRVFGHSGRTLKDSWDEYTSRVKSDAHLYIVDLASEGDFSMPPGYHNVHQISGWSESIIDYIVKYEQIDDVIEAIGSIEPEDY